MKIVFVSNYFNHHQKAFCDEMHNLTDGKYFFIETIPMREERAKLGYAIKTLPEYVISAYKNQELMFKAEKMIAGADIVIYGSAPEKMIRKRIIVGKPVFRYNERCFKKAPDYKEVIIRFVKEHIKNPIGKPIYMLCASAYTSEDYRILKLFKNKTYKWGYFPQTKKYDDIQSLIKLKNKSSILWCGRFLDWKRPVDAIECAKKLKNAGYSFELNFIGTGEQEDIIRKKIKKYKLENNVNLLGAKSPEIVREYMEKSGIYIFTSDRNEGWGAVLNESMNSACAVVASNEIGAAPFLIKDGNNGLIYKTGDVDMLFEKLKYLLDNYENQDFLGENAYYSIINEWNSREAAKRFMNIAEDIVNVGKICHVYSSGPCSRA